MESRDYVGGRMKRRILGEGGNKEVVVEDGGESNTIPFCILQCPKVEEYAIDTVLPFPLPIVPWTSSLTNLCSPSPFYAA